MPTTAVVLAAGLGKRLRTATLLPKWLAPVGSTTPAGQQLEACAALPLREVVVVVGPGAGAVEDVVAGWRDRVDIRLLENPFHAERNNWYSLLLALQSIESGDDALVFNSDLFAAASWLQEAAGRLLAAPEPAALGIDGERPLVEEAMKVSADGDLVTRIGKTGVIRPVGEYVGISWWAADAAAELACHLRTFVDRPAAADHWYEHGIDQHLRAGGRYSLVPVPSVDWVEIDDPDDLAIAAGLARRHRSA